MSLVSMALVLGLWVIGLIPVVGIFIDIAILILVVPLILMLPFSYLEHDGSFKAIVSKTVDIISGHRVRIYGMIISFIFWILLSCLTFGLLLFYVIPYMYLSVGLLYLNFTHEKEFKKKNRLRDGYVILIFAGAVVLVSAVIMFYFPKTTVWFNAILTGKMDTTGSETLSYGGMSVTYDIPNGYKISSSTDITKTYINKDNDNILQYSIYLSDVEDNLDMDKEIVNELKLSSEYKVTDKEFKLRVNGHNLKGYRYNSTNNYHATSSTVTVYYPKDSFTIAISLTNNTGKKLTEKDISKYVTVY